MTPEQKSWIDNASYQELIDKVRTEPVESEWFEGRTGDYLYAALLRTAHMLCSQDAALADLFLSVPESDYVSPPDSE